MFQQVKKILFTTDLSEGAREIFLQAVYLADKLGASITLLHVIEDIPEGPQAIVRETLGKEAFEKLEQEKASYARNVMIGKQKEAPMIETVLHKLSEEASGVGESNNKPVAIDNVQVAIGRIDEQICLAATTNNCELIVMGHRSRGSIGDALFGGTVRKVIRKSDKQVYVVPRKKDN